MFGTCEFPRFWTLSRLNYDVSRHAMLGNERKWICTVCAVFDNDRDFLIKTGGAPSVHQSVVNGLRVGVLVRVSQMFRDFFDRA